MFLFKYANIIFELSKTIKILKNKSKKLFVSMLDYNTFADLKKSSFIILERCQSGRMGLPAKELYLYGYQGFESLSLRKK